MSNLNFKVIIACYGGGHVQSLIPVIQQLIKEPRIELNIIGFTTARAAFERAGIIAKGYSIFEKYLTMPCPEIAQDFVSDVGHKDVTMDETFAYFHVGIHDLILKYGYKTALEKVKKHGRSIFSPVETFTHFLSEIKPDLVVTSTSPRSELALQRAANALGITGLAISDLFLQHEVKYICDGNYAKHITVFSDYVANYLRRSSCNDSFIYVTGNPAFDKIFSTKYKIKGQKIRQEFSLKNTEYLITWIGTPGNVSLIGKKFVESKKIINYLENFCEKHHGYHFAFRPHPNRPVRLPSTIKYGMLLDSNYSIESVLWASDIVVLETSTVGLQAALIKKPVITIAAEDYPPYKEMGISVDVDKLDDLGDAIIKKIPPDLALLKGLSGNSSANKVVEVIYRLLGLNKNSKAI